MKLTIIGNQSPAITVTSNKYAKVVNNNDGTWTVTGAKKGTAKLTITSQATENYAKGSKTVKIKIY